MDPFLGEIRFVGFNYAPSGWAFCAGQILQISQNIALFSLLGTTYGGNGTSTFALPNLQGRLALGQGQGTGLSAYALGQMGGDETVALTAAQLPAHTHGIAAGSGLGTTNDPTQGVFAKPKIVRGGNLYAPSGGALAAADTLAVAGAGAGHENRMPGLALYAIIALQGVYPQRA